MRREMKRKRIRSTIKSSQMILLGIGLCILFWIIESVIHTFVFGMGDLISQMFTSDLNEIWMRSIIACLLILFGIYAQYAIKNYRQAKEALRKAHAELEERVKDRTRELMHANQNLQREVEAHLQTEKTLKESETRYSALFENMREGIAVYETLNNGEDFIFVDFNKAGEMIEDVRKENLIGKSVLEIFPGVRDFGLFDVFQRVWKTEKPEHYPITFYKDERIAGWRENYIYKLQSGEIVAVYSDETESKQAEATLRESENRYRLLAENVHDGICIFQDGKLVFVNPALSVILGYTREELTGIDPFILFGVDYRDRFRDSVKALEKGAHVKDFHAVCIRKGGRKIWIEVRHNRVQWRDRFASLLTIRDITDIRRRVIASKEEKEQLHRENIKLRASIKERYKFGNIVGKCSAMQDIYELILKASTSNANVVVLGESGTGKELIARAIHDASARGKNIFAPVNCGAIPINLAESEFFGHCKGAFTGAHMNKSGYLHTADGGTLFLDEVAELEPNMQVKLLRTLESGEYTPLGETHPRKSDLRFISATNKDLTLMIVKGLMREDFYYRISVIPITLPPLRERKEDIPLLIEHFLKLHGNGGKISTIPGRIMEILFHYDWPGNVRELQSVIQRYLALGDFDFVKVLSSTNSVQAGLDLNPVGEFVNLKQSMEQFEKQSILSALNKCLWHKGETAETLGIDPKTLYSKIKKFGLDPGYRANMPDLN